MIFENEGCPDFRYTQRGTAFFVHYADLAYAVTAHHVVHDYHPRQYRLLRSFGGDDCFELGQPFSPNGAGEHSWADFVVMPLMHTVADASKDVFLWPLPAKQVTPLGGRRIWVDGYPDPQRDTHYDLQKLEFQSGIIQASYEGLAEEPGIHRLRVESHHDLPTVSGFSGSPAYMVPDSDGTLAGTQLIGLVIQGSVQSNLFRIIGTDVIKALIEADRL